MSSSWRRISGLALLTAVLASGCGAAVPRGPETTFERVQPAPGGLRVRLALDHRELLVRVQATLVDRCVVETVGRFAGGHEAVLAVREGGDCRVEPYAGRVLGLVGEAGRHELRTDDTGEAWLDLGLLPPERFPYRTTLGTWDCAGCGAAPLRLPAEVGARLVLARNLVADHDAWLAVHAGAPETAQVHAARRQEVERQRALQAEAQRQGWALVERRAWIEAARAVDGCFRLPIEPAPGCVELRREIERRFAAEQLEHARAAAAQGRFDAADHALYLCLLVEREQPACQRELERVAALRAEAAQAAAEAQRRQELAKVKQAARRALQRRRPAEAQQWLAKCAALAPEDAWCRKRLRRK